MPWQQVWAQSQYQELGSALIFNMNISVASRLIMLKINNKKKRGLIFKCATENSDVLFVFKLPVRLWSQRNALLQGQCTARRVKVQIIWKSVGCRSVERCGVQKLKVAVLQGLASPALSELNNGSSYCAAILPLILYSLRRGWWWGWGMGKHWHCFWILKRL